MIKNEVMYKIMKDMVMYLTPYQLKKLKTTLQDKLENVEINLILDKEKLIADRSSNDKLLKMFLSAKNVEGCSSKTLKYYREILEKFIKDIDKPIKETTTDEIRHYLTNYREDRGCSLYDFLYNMVLFIGLEKGKKELESENYHSLEEFEKFITELGVKK